MVAMTQLNATLHKCHYLKWKIESRQDLPRIGADILWLDKGVEQAVWIGSTFLLAAFCIIHKLCLKVGSGEIQAFFGLPYPACWKH